MVAIFFSFEFPVLGSFVHDGFGNDGAAFGAYEITIFSIEDEGCLVVVAAGVASFVLCDWANKMIENGEINKKNGDVV